MHGRLPLWRRIGYPAGMSTEDISHRGLLPPGLGDMLPPEAALEALLIERLTARFAAQGYERVKPPLVEYEESLFGGAGQAMAAHTFRLMDPESRRMMGLRADMTLQVARIATTRLKDAARPLRLSYAGNVLRMKATQLRPVRQFAQVGFELIGSDAAAADAEAILLAVDALRGVGVPELSVDLNLPTLVTAICAALGLDEAVVSRLRRALERKDEAALRRSLAGAVGDGTTGMFAALLRAVGPAAAGIVALRLLDLPAAARAEAARLADVVGRVQAAMPDLHLTIDPVEYRGLEYQDGVSFTVFARGAMGEAGRGELGRGGRYRAGYPDAGGTEPATGCTLYMDTVLGVARIGVPARRLFVPAEVAWAALAALREQGWLTVQGLVGVSDIAAEARRLGCPHGLVGGRVEAV